MEIPKAIEILIDIRKVGTEPGYPIDDAALGLGIEALAFIKHWREAGHMFCEEPLPGEDTLGSPSLEERPIQKLQESPLGREPKG